MHLPPQRHVSLYAHLERSVGVFTRHGDDAIRSLGLGVPTDWRGNDTGAPPPPPFTLLRSVAHGIWEQTGRRRFRATFRFFRFGTTGAYVGRNEVSRTIEVGKNGDELTSTSSVKIFDGNDTRIGTGCATDTGQRLEFAE